MENIYRHLLKWSLNHRRIVVAIAILSFVAGAALIPLIPKGFIPKLDRGAFNVAYTVSLPKSLPLGNFETNPQSPKPNLPSDGGFDWIGEIARSPERLLLRRGIRVGQQLEEAVLALPDVDSVFTIAGLRGEPTKGKLFVQLKEQRQRTTAEVEEQVRRALPQLKGVAASVEDIPFVQTEAEKPLQIAIQGENLPILRQTAEKIQSKVKKLPGLADIALSSGQEAVNLERLNSQYAIYLSANLAAGRGLEDAAREIESLAQPLLPPGVTLQRWGNSAHSSNVLGSFGGTLALSVILMLLVLIFLFRRLLEPLVVGLSLPLSLVGAMLGLLVTGSDFGIISLIGLIFLVGLLNKNALLLMDYANQLRQWGFSREEALIETGAIRLRPILMTTASTILGMLPIALGWGAGAELRQPMAMAIIGGLTTSSLLSLIVVPVFYTLLEDGWLKIRGKERF
jgi:multidrug efflux pump subunit AcrB